MQTPLLAQEDQNEAPSLLSQGPASQEEESALSRLINESTPAAGQLSMYGPSLDETIAIALQGRMETSYVTIAAITTVVLQWGFCWGAFLSDSWSSVHLKVSIGWQEKFLPWLNTYTDTVIQESSIFSISSALSQSQNYVTLIILWVCSVILPCTFMIVCPVWVASDYNSTSSGISQMDRLRMVLELTLRMSLLVVFCFLLLDMAIGGIALETTETIVKLHSEIEPSFLCFLLGMTCAIASVVILRIPSKKKIDGPRAPPSSAFLPWPNQDVEATYALVDESEQSDYMVSNNSNNDLNLAQPAPAPVSCLQAVVVFQLGVVSALLWIPSLFLPQFRIFYDGLVNDLLETKAFTMFLWGLPKVWWHQSVEAGTPIWILVVMGICLFVLVIGIPIAALVFGFLTWRNEGAVRQEWCQRLRLCQPALCGIVCSIALCATVGSFKTIGTIVDDGICRVVETVVHDHCLVVRGILLPGAWFYLAQNICLELFVYLTILWVQQA